MKRFTGLIGPGSGSVGSGMAGVASADTLTFDSLFLRDPTCIYPGSRPGYPSSPSVTECDVE